VVYLLQVDQQKLTCKILAGIAFGSIYVFCYNASIGGAAYTILAETATPRLRVKTIAICLAFQNVWSVSYDELSRHSFPWPIPGI
jgi:hypothetical protein